jgi:integrase
LGLFGTLSISGPRPGEVYALDWAEAYLDAEKPYFRIVRAWCSKGFRFYSPKTEAGRRAVPISAWSATVLREHRARSGGQGLVFPSTAGTPLNKANVRKRVWTDPAQNGKDLFRRLQQQDPGAYPDCQLRTLQRRLKEWRSQAAHELIFGAHHANADAAVELKPRASAADAADCPVG